MNRSVPTRLGPYMDDADSESASAIASGAKTSIGRLSVMAPTDAEPVTVIESDRAAQKPKAVLVGQHVAGCQPGRLRRCRRARDPSRAASIESAREAIPGVVCVHSEGDWFSRSLGHADVRSITEVPLAGYGARLRLWASRVSTEAGELRIRIASL